MLNKAIYSLKQAGRAWQHSLFDVIKMQNFKQSMKGSCIWLKEKDKKLTLIGAYVDDILITGDDRKDIEEISTILGKAFQMKHMGELSEFLGIEAVYSNDGIKLCQRKFEKQVAQQFEQLNCKPTGNPMAKRYEPSENDEKRNDYPIRQAIGCLMYLANATRPDLCFAVNNLSRFVNEPTKTLWHAIQRVIKYLNTTAELGLVYKKSSFDIHGWSDSDFANDTEDRKSTTGWVFKLGENTISWKSKKQSTVSLSTTEAEYQAASDATKEAIWLQDLLFELGINKRKVAVLYQDNQGAIFLQKNSTNKSRTKHIDIRHHFIREHVDQGRITIQYCPTAAMIADMLTKPLPNVAFRRHRSAITAEPTTTTNDSVSEGEC
jgi:hypothetical protein